MKFGLLLTTQHYPGDDPRRVLDGQLAMLSAARVGGWDSVWGGQHYLQIGLAGLQPMPFLGRLIADAGDMTIGMSIHLLSLQNPVQAAEDAATLDVLSSGRFVYGIGLGYRDVEYEAFGLDRSDGVERFETNLDVIRRLWSGASLDVDLPWCRIDDVALTLQLVQRPHPPVWIAANSDAAVKRAARLGDAWLMNPHATLRSLTRQQELYTMTREEAKLPPPAQTPMVREAICAEEGRAARALAAQYLGDKYRSYIGWGQDKALPADDRGFDAPYDELGDGRFVVGSPAECADQLHLAVTSVGVDHFIFRVNWAGMDVADSVRTIALLTAEVLPQLCSAAE